MTAAALKDRPIVEDKSDLKEKSFYLEDKKPKTPEKIDHKRSPVRIPSVEDTSCTESLDESPKREKPRSQPVKGYSLKIFTSLCSL